jgi:exodeoxyribonuclease VII small subunit
MRGLQIEFEGQMPQGSQSEKGDSFEKNLERLEKIVSQLEAIDLPLEKALQLYEEGMQLSAACQKQLDEAEGRVEILKKRASGRMEAEPFPVENENTK